VPRTFPTGHLLAGHLRLTVRSADEDDRLIAAAREIGIDSREDPS
jgi:histidinol-phosphate/aromatic aminotransferase/cobyric acid decarboxylase-like protein